MLKYIRILMFLMICYLYFSTGEKSSIPLEIYPVIAALIYTVTHLFTYTAAFEKHFLLITGTDFALTAVFGFLYPGTTLYLILFGIVAVTVFLGTSDKRILTTYSILFFLVWLSVMTYTKFISAGPADFLDNVMTLFFVVFSALVGSLIQKLTAAREQLNTQYDELTSSHEALSMAHEKLHDYSKQVEELTMTRERNRMAREIHDTVGHKMTALLVQIELAKEFLKSAPEKAEETIGVCGTLARTALEEIRVSVRTIHTDEAEPHLLPSLRKLMEDFYKTTGLETSFEVKGDPAAIPSSLHVTIIRVVQESLTNARRHGNASGCNILLSCSEASLRLEIKDNGAGTGEIDYGFGLINMKERMEEHGGNVSFESEAGSGFKVTAEFPLLVKKWSVGGNG
ncbi:sensor histidine kinase [Metabacillus sp. GX 13764]|uniref:sensor histidine kinase n=1 Tax=Metabacillus kandeliae TaxID=2900151 RepID=UPI001E2BA409|nr:sensor histidine kinase [Metabacillus kandeliae]MCD7033996.1 sensor histidine kinase [Metabacillus kandeliae]